MTWLRALCNDDTGAALPEYALVLGLLGMLSIASLAMIANFAETTLEGAFHNFEQLEETPPQ